MAPPPPGLASSSDDPDDTYDLMRRIGITDEDIASAIREDRERLELAAQYGGLILDLQDACARHGVSLPDVSVYDRYGDTPGIYFDLGYCPLDSVQALVAVLKAREPEL